MAPDVEPQDAASDRVSAEAPEAPPVAGESAAEAMRAAWAHVVELKTDAGYFVAAKIDQLRLSIRQMVLLAVLGILAVLAVAGTIITAVVLLLEGIAGGLGALCGHNPWLGDVLCGALVLGAMLLGLSLALKHMNKLSRDLTVKKYESRNRKQPAGPR